MGLSSINQAKAKPKTTLEILQSDPEKSWQNLILTFWNFNFTKLTDRLLALSGIARVFSPTFKSQYMAGTWECLLPHSLLWICEDGDSREGLRGIVPSWSWASIYGGHLIPPQKMTMHSSLKVLGAKCQINGKNPFGNVSDWFIDLQSSYAIPDSILPFNPDEPKIRIGVEGVYFVVGKDERMKGVEETISDLKSLSALSSLRILLVGCSTVEHRPNRVWYEALVLRKSSTKEDCYERYGYANAPFLATPDDISKQNCPSTNLESTPKASTSINPTKSNIIETDSHVPRIGIASEEESPSDINPFSDSMMNFGQRDNSRQTESIEEQVKFSDSTGNNEKGLVKDLVKDEKMGSSVSPDRDQTSEEEEEEESEDNSFVNALENETSLSQWSIGIFRLI
jgi:hypothetical protein